MSDSLTPSSCSRYTNTRATISSICIRLLRGPKLGTYSDWGLSSVLVINKHLSHHHCCVSYTHKDMVVYRKLKVTLAYGILKSSKISQRNGYGKTRAAAVTWQAQFLPGRRLAGRVFTGDGTLAERACTGEPCNNILGGSGCHVTAAAHVFPLPFQ